MDASLKPWFTSGVALVGASAIAIAPIVPIPTTTPAAQVRSVTAAVSTQFDLTALDIPYLLTLPIVRQYLRNYVENWAMYLGGFAKSGVGIVQSLASIPGVTVEVIQQVLALDFVGAFDTITSALRDATVAIGQPLVDSLVWRYEKYYGVAAALGSAVPQAFIDVVNGFLLAGNVVTTSLIQGTQDLIAAVLTFNLSNILNAAVDGTVNFVGALVDGGGLIVDGIESAQYGIATALAFDPSAPGFAAADVSALRTLSADSTISVTGGAADVPEVVAPEEPAAEELSSAEVDAAVAPEAVEEAATPAVEPEATVVDAELKTDEPTETVSTSTDKVDSESKDAGGPKDAAEAPKATATVDEPAAPSGAAGVDKPAADKPGTDKPATDRPAGDKASDGGNGGGDGA